MKEQLKESAIKLRVEEQLSLEKISDKLGISKSTASVWLRDYPLSEDVKRSRQKEWAKSEDGKNFYSYLSETLKNKEYPAPTSWGKIRKKIFLERGRKCERCGWAEVNPFNGHVPVQIDHINGDNSDHRPENLMVLCPNCHSLTEHFMFYGRKHKK